MSKLKSVILSFVVLFVFIVLPGTANAYSGPGVVECSGYLNLRQSPSTGAQVLDKLYPGTKINIEDSANGWHKVNHNGVIGWVSWDYVAISTPVAATAPSAVETSTSSDNTKSLVEYAQKYLGTRYVYGGASPKGFDCSGFTSYVYGQIGISLNRRASQQALQGTAVKRVDLQTGDLVFFDTDGGHNSISHVGIYIGNDKFIHAESGGMRVVRTSSLSESYYNRNYMTARRVLN